jgi:adenosylhomocysteine nucleosidase
VTIGIICAMPEEVAGFLQQPQEPADDGSHFVSTTIAGRETVVASCGLGKVRAAMTASVLIERFGCDGLVSAGTAGGLARTQPMQVVIGSELIQHDYGRSLGLRELELYRPGLPPLPENRAIEQVLSASDEQVRRFRDATGGLDFVVFGRYASGDTFVNDGATRKRLESLEAVAVDMECGAVAQVAEFYGVPWLVAKGISDHASGMSHEDFLVGVAEASRRSGEVVERLIPAWLGD